MVKVTKQTWGEMKENKSKPRKPSKKVINLVPMLEPG